jgi:hypothetical protein
VNSTLLDMVRACSIIAVLASPATAAAQGAATVTAVASVKGAGGADASAPFTLVVTRFATDDERDALMAVVRKGGTAAAREILAARADVGTIQLGGRHTAVKYAYRRETGAGRLITAITAEPIAFVGAGLPDAKPKAGWDLGLVLLEVPASGSGRGELAPAAKVRVTDQGAIVTEDYGAAIVELTKVTGK